MKKLICFNLIVTLITVFVLMSCQTPQKGKEQEVKKSKKTVKRIGMVIGIKSDRLEEYKKVHADSNPGVRDLLTEANMENFSIFMHQFDDGKYYLFGYYEYTGDNFDADMAKLAEKPRNIEWLKMCDPMQIPFEGEESWSVMEQLYYNE